MLELLNKSPRNGGLFSSQTFWGGRMLERASSIEGAKTTRGPYHKQSRVVFVFPTAAAHSKWKINFVPRTYRRRAPCLGAPLSGQVSCPKLLPIAKRSCANVGGRARVHLSAPWAAAACAAASRSELGRHHHLSKRAASDGPLARGLVFWQRADSWVLDRERRER